MDVRRLIDRVTAALGAAATPERVEAVAALVLETAVPTVPPSPEPAPGGPAGPTASPAQRALVVAYGVDRPGVAEALTRTASDAGCVVAHTSRHVLEGYFSLIMILDVSALHVSLAELQQRLSTAAVRLNVSALVQHEWLFKTTKPA